jgi:hypothetical protein
MLNLGDLVQLKAHIQQKNQHRYKAEQLYNPNNVYGVITKISSGYYDSTTTYYTVLWFITGDSYKYDAEELSKVS